MQLFFIEEGRVARGVAPHLGDAIMRPINWATLQPTLGERLPGPDLFTNCQVALPRPNEFGQTFTQSARRHSACGALVTNHSDGHTLLRSSARRLQIGRNAIPSLKGLPGDPDIHTRMLHTHDFNKGGRGAEILNNS
jgi:hypothetical protein